MSHGPLDAALHRFLGLPPDAGDEAVLGLDARQARVPAAIDAAARRRIETVRRHPDGRGPEAELVVARVGLAASRLRGRLATGDAPAVGPRAAPVPGTSTPSSSRPASAESASPPPSTRPALPAASAPASPPASAPLRSRRDAPARPPAAARRSAVSAAGASDTAVDPASLPPLTPFDRAVLGTLVGHGGWNRRSRARLVALATAHGVGPRGLMNVVRGLAAYAGAGGRLVGIDEIARDFAVIAGGRAAGPVATVGPDGEAAASRGAADEAAEVARRLIPELEGDGLWPAAKIAALVLLVLALLAIPLLRVLEPEDAAPAVPAAAGTGGAGATGAAGGAGGTAGAGGGTTTGEPPEDPGARLVHARIPWIEGPPPGAGLLESADAMGRLPARIEADVQRRLEVGTAPAEATWRRWAVAMSEAERGWTRATPSEVRAVRRAAAAAVLAAGERPAVVERLLESLRPPVGPAVTEPTSDGAPGTWAGAWRASVLAVIAADPFAPEAAVRAARGLLEATLTRPGTEPDPRFDPRPEAGPREVAAAWLSLAVEEHLALLGSPGGDAADADRTAAAAVAWERWLEAGEALDATRSVRTLGPRLLVAALEGLLRSPADLAEDGPAAGLLGRLLVAMPDPPPPVFRELVRAAYLDPEVASVPDLRALASILALRRDLAWFRADLVPPPDATEATRARFLDFALAAWPEVDEGPTGGRPLAVDPERLRSWRTAVESVRAEPEPLGPIGELRRAAWLGELAEAAHLLAAGRLDEMDAVLEALAADVARVVVDAGDGGRPARPREIPGAAATDGEWSRSWEATRGRGEPALARLRALRTEAGADLGPIDARTFAEIVTGSATSRAREIAQSILLERFRDAPNVVMELLDALPAARVDRRLRRTVHRLTGVPLPAEDDERWRSLARAALLEHAISVVGRDEDPASRLAERLAETLDRRAAVLRRDRGPAMLRAGPAAAAARLAEAWLAAAESRLAIVPVPATAAELRRRAGVRTRLATDAVQSSVAGLVTASEAVAFVVAAEQPTRADACARVLDRSRADRDAATTASAQWLAAERAILELWEIRLGTDGDGAGGGP